MRRIAFLPLVIAHVAFAQPEAPTYRLLQNGRSFTGPTAHSSLSAGHRLSDVQIKWMQGGHAEALVVAISPDGSRLVTAANNGSEEDSTIKIWNFATGELLRTLPADPSNVDFHEGVVSLSFSPDGGLLASGELNGRISIWQTNTWTLATRFYSTGLSCNSQACFLPTVLSIEFSPDGKLLACASSQLLSTPPAVVTGGIIDVWRTRDWSLLRTLSGQGTFVHSISFQTDGVQLAAAAEQETFVIWNAYNGSRLHTVVTGEAIQQVAFSPTGLTLTSSGVHGLLQLWDPSTWQQTATLSNHQGTVSSLSYSANGNELSGVVQNTVRVWDVPSGNLLQTITGFINRPMSAVLSADGTTVASGGGQGRAYVQLSSVETGAIIQTFNRLISEIPSIAISADGTRVAVGETALYTIGSRNFSVYLFDAKDGSNAGLLQGHLAPITSLAAHPTNPNRLASASSDKSVRVWDLQSQQTVGVFLGHATVVTAVAYSNQAPVVASADSSGLIKVWDGDSEQEIITLSGHTRAVRALAFSPDGSTLASASSDRTVKLWDVSTGNEVHSLSHAAAVDTVAFSHQGTALVSGSWDGQIRFWNSNTGQELFSLNQQSGPVRAVAFSPDGTLLATASDDRRLHLWNGRTGAPWQILQEEMGNGVESLAFSPTGRWFSYGRSDATLVAADYLSILSLSLP